MEQGRKPTEYYTDDNGTHPIFSDYDTINATDINVSGTLNAADINVSGTLNATSINDTDGDTRITVEETADEDRVHVYTVGTKRMTIDENGNVVVNNDINIQGTTTLGNTILGVGKKISDADGDTYIVLEETTDQDRVYVYTVSTKRLTIDENGKAVFSNVPENALDIAPDTDVYIRIGKAWIGYYGSTGEMGLGHIDHRSVASAGFKQSSIGNTYINAIDGKTIYFRTGNVDRILMGPTKFRPATDSAMILGDSTHCWSTVYRDAEAGCSDKRLKKNIAASDLGLDFILALKPIRFNSIKCAEKVKDVHYGLAAQDIKEAADKLGKEFHGYLHDEESDNWFWSPQEFIAPIIKAIQELNNKISQLEIQNGTRQQRPKRTVA